MKESKGIQLHVRGNRGFTLLEVIISISILALMVISISAFLQSGLDVKVAISSNSKVTHRMNFAMRRMANDLKHVYVLDNNDTNRVISGQNHTMFKLDKTGSSDKVYMTTMNHSALRSNAKESDLGFVVYEVRKDDKGFTHLYRGALGRIPESFREDPPMKIVTKYIKSIKIQPWRGDDWTDFKWNSLLGDTRNKAPHMVKLIIEGFDETPDPGMTSDELESFGTVKYATTLYLPYSAAFKEMREKVGSIRFN